MRGILAITYLPVSQCSQNDITNHQAAGLTLIGILSPYYPAIVERYLGGKAFTFADMTLACRCLGFARGA